MTIYVFSRSSQVLFSSIQDKVLLKINDLSTRQKTTIIAISLFISIIALGYVAYRCIKNRKIETQQTDLQNLNNPVIPENLNPKEQGNNTLEQATDH